MVLVSRVEGDLDLVFPGVSTLRCPKTLSLASAAALLSRLSLCICSIVSNFSSAIRSDRALTFSNSVFSPDSSASSDDLGTGDVGTGGSSAFWVGGRTELDPSPRCVTWGLLFLTVGTPSSSITFVVRDVDVDDLFVDALIILVVYPNMPN